MSEVLKIFDLRKPTHVFYEKKLLLRYFYFVHCARIECGHHFFNYICICNMCLRSPHKLKFAGTLDDG